LTGCKCWLQILCGKHLYQAVAEYQVSFSFYAQSFLLHCMKHPHSFLPRNNIIYILLENRVLLSKLCDLPMYARDDVRHTKRGSVRKT
jgi:hypothetical protein